MRRHIRPMIAGALLCAAAPASAVEPLPTTPHTGPYNPGFFYMSVGGFGQVQQRPGFTYGGLELNDMLVKSTLDADVFGGGPAITVGYTFSRGALARLGSRTRIEFAFAYFRGAGSDEADATLAYANGSFDTRLLDGTSSIASLFVIGGGDTFTSAESLRVTVNQYDTGLRLRSDFALGPRFTLTPSLGVIGGGDNARYRYSFVQTFPALNRTRSADVKETTDSFYFGGEFGLQVSFRATRRLALHAGGTIAVVHRHAKLTGTDCHTLSGFLSCGQPGSTSSIRSTDSKTGIQVGMSIGASYDLGWLKVSLTGFARFDNTVPGVDNPDVTLDNIGSAAIEPAKVDFDSAWSYGGMLMLSFPLG